MARSVDVLVAGAGNAALCAALEARSRGASVLLLERAPREWRGGNSKYTRNVRVAHGPGDDLMPGEYTPEEMLADLEEVTGTDYDRSLASLVAERSERVPHWMESHGARWQNPMRGTLQLGRTNRFFLGGGKALLNGYYRRAEALGVHIRYNCTVKEITFAGDRISGAVIENSAGVETVTAGACVIATGGFESNIGWLREYWGDRVDGFKIRGTRYNDGLLLRQLLDLGVIPRGNPEGFHAVAVDERAPRFEGGIVTRVDSVPFSIMVNVDGVRFADEGENLWPKRYASWGKLIAQQPQQKAFSIFDAKAVDRFIGGAYKPLAAHSIAELAQLARLPAETLARTVSEYNAAVVDGSFDPTCLDGCTTKGLPIPKSNWALPIDTPPYYCFALVPGITFTYLGVAVDDSGRVRHESGASYENLYAAGEVMAGNVLRHGYLAGFGMTLGSVFGVLAGAGAASSAR